MRNGLRVLLLAAVVAILWSNTGIVAAPPVQRSYSASLFMLELDGVSVGFVSAVEGGLPFGDVVKQAGEDFFFKKHIGNASYRDIRLEFGINMDDVLSQWISSSLQGNYSRKDGAIVAADFQGNVRRRLEFTRAQITEVTFPALDGASKEPARLSIVLTPEQTSLDRKPSGKLTAKTTVQKNALSSSFRLMIDGLDTTRVSKIESLTVKLPLLSGGGDEEACLHCDVSPQFTLPRIDFPNVIVTLSESSAASWYDWFEDFVIAGNNDDSKEKNGSLEYLTANLQTTLLTLTFKNLGIFSLTPAVDEGQSAIARLKAEMYCEVIELQIK